MTSKAFELARLGNAYSDGALSNRNLVINGAMQVAQRGDSTGVTGAAYYGPDRYRFTVGSAGVGAYTISQDTDAPSGFGYSYKIDCTTADASPDATDAVFLATRFEGQNLQRLKKGTADAASVTLSFWVKSNLTGTYQANLFDLDNTRIIGATYTISVAGTWEYKTITFVGDTSGAFSNDNGLSLQVEWALDGGTTYTSGAVPTSWEATSNADRAAGLTVNLADNTSNYWQLTGVQLEVGDTATPFEHRPYGDELARCMRYYQKVPIKDRTLVHHSNGEYGYGGNITYQVPMRASPTSSGGGSCQVYPNGYIGGALVSSATFQLQSPTSNGSEAYVQESLMSNSYAAYYVRSDDVLLDAEL